MAPGPGHRLIAQASGPGAASTDLVVSTNTIEIHVLCHVDEEHQGPLKWASPYEWPSADESTGLIINLNDSVFFECQFLGQLCIA